MAFASCLAASFRIRLISLVSMHIAEIVVLGEIRQNILSIATFIGCVVWLCHRISLIQSVSSFLKTHINDSHRILLPTLATFILPFSIPFIFQFVQPVTKTNIGYLVPSITTLITFVTAQKLVEKRRSDDRKIAEWKTLRVLRGELEANASTLQKNIDNIRDEELMKLKQGYPLNPELLSAYSVNNLELVIRDRPNVLFEVHNKQSDRKYSSEEKGEIYFQLANLSKHLNDANRLIKLRQEAINIKDFIVGERGTLHFEVEHLDRLLIKESSIISEYMESIISRLEVLINLTEKTWVGMPNFI